MPHPTRPSTSTPVLGRSTDSCPSRLSTIRVRLLDVPRQAELGREHPSLGRQHATRDRAESRRVPVMAPLAAREVVAEIREPLERPSDALDLLLRQHVMPLESVAGRGRAAAHLAAALPMRLRRPLLPRATPHSGTRRLPSPRPGVRGRCQAARCANRITDEALRGLKPAVP